MIRLCVCVIRKTKTANSALFGHETFPADYIQGYANNLSFFYNLVDLDGESKSRSVLWKPLSLNPDIDFAAQKNDDHPISAIVIRVN